MKKAIKRLEIAQHRLERINKARSKVQLLKTRKQVAQNLKLFRAVSQLTLEEVAYATNDLISRTSLHAMENEAQVPSAELLEALSVVFGISVEDFFRDQSATPATI